MKSIEAAIKKFPQEFMTTIEARSQTTPNETNRLQHLAMYEAIGEENWDEVHEILCSRYSAGPLTGVVYCLETYSGIENEAWHEICALFEADAIVALPEDNE